MKRILAALCVVWLAGCEERQQEAGPNPYMAGGATTVFVTGSNAYSMPAPNLSASALATHLEGDMAFEQTFVTAPAPVNSGLGPVFNNTSCINCHVRDGRGEPVVGGSIGSLLFRLSVPGHSEHGGPNPVPKFGGQLQVRAVVGHAPEGNILISFEEIEGTYPDGEGYVLQKPSYSPVDVYEPLPALTMWSPRFARPVFGLGLLEAVGEAEILALADEFDMDGDSISGRPNYVWDVVREQLAIGRFGWKANQPSLLQQVATAYQQDMGITSYVHPREASYGQSNSDTLSDDPELDSLILDAVTFYNQTLGVPAPRDLESATVRLGQDLFKQVGCAGCHTPSLKTDHFQGIAEISNQVIFPYTDLLLHDMGEALSDGRPDFLATGSEWRTPPLWGIGLSEVVNGHTFFLHDGRARNVEEAILWHGGEASRSLRLFKSLPPTQRMALIAFINSL